jgi:hypothetical protein
MAKKMAKKASTIRQNVKLKISGVKLYDLAEKYVKGYKSCLSKIICSEGSVSCYQGDRL